MGYMNEFPHTTMFDSDLRQILELIAKVMDLPNEFNELKKYVETYFGDNFSKVMNEWLENNKTEIYSATSSTLHVYNVLAYGADKTGISDSTTAFNSAISDGARNRGIVFIPGGEYKIGTLEIPDNHPCVIIGEGKEVTKLNCIANSCMTFNGWCSYLSGMLIECSNGTAVSFTANAPNSTISNVKIIAHKALEMTGVVQKAIDCELLGDSVVVDVGGLDCSSKITRCTVRANVLRDGIGIYIRPHSSTITISECDILLCNTGIHLDTSANIFSIEILDSFIDNCNYCLVNVDGGTIYRSIISGCWMQADVTAALLHIGSCDGLTIENCQILKSDGIKIKGGTNLIANNRFMATTQAILARYGVLISHDNIFGNVGGYADRMSYAFSRDSSVIWSTSDAFIGADNHCFNSAENYNERLAIE